MRIDLGHDRLDHHPGRYCDPVVTRTGVFAQIEGAALSEAEQLRSQKVETRGLKYLEEPAQEWTPKTVLKRVTDLYARFVKPQGGTP